MNSHALRPLGSTGLLCHPLGFGSYRISNGIAVHKAALRHYLAQGGNLIDTSANYTDGSSETLIGEVIKEFRQSGPIVVTKAGYVQGENMRLAQSRSFPEVVKYGQGLWHCIHPEFLQTQVERSLRRLQLDAIDVFLLHNPEYFLSERARHQKVDASLHGRFYERIARAFAFLEDKVKEGSVRWFGISSNNFGLATSHPQMTSVERCWKEAERITTDHHFRVIQLPMNLYESGGALEHNNTGQTVLEFCDRKRLGVLVNRPLNAFSGNSLIRLADFSDPGAKTPSDNQASLLQRLREHETRLRTQFAVPFMGSSERSLSGTIEGIIPQVSSAEEWDQVVQRHLAAPIAQWIEDVQSRVGQQPEFSSWLQQFFEILSETFEKVELQIRARQQVVSDTVRYRLMKSGYPHESQSLSQMALGTLISLQGVSSVLVGMRKPAYVDDAMGSVSISSETAKSVLSDFSHVT